MADRRGPACRYGSTVVEFDVGSNAPNCMSGWLIAVNVAPRLLRAYQRLQLGVKRGHEYCEMATRQFQLDDESSRRTTGTYCIRNFHRAMNTLIPALLLYIVLR